MRVTRKGVALILVGVVIYLLARQSLLGWFYVANAVVWAIVLVNLALPWWNLRGIKATRRLAKENSRDIFEGDAVQVDIELTNLGLTPKVFFTVVEQSPLASPHSPSKRFLVGTLPSRSPVAASYVEQSQQRGEFVFEPLVLETSAPFGLFLARRRVQAPLKVLVYPEVHPFSGIQTIGSPVEGTNLPTPARHTGEFRGAREYQSGDSLRSVHWRSSARRGRLMIKEYDRSPENQVTVVFDATKSFGEAKDTTLEYSIKLAASIARVCYLNGTAFNMTPPGAGTQLPSWRAVLEYLARLRLGQGPGLVDSVGAGAPQGRIVAIIALADGTAVDAISRLPISQMAAAVVMQGFAPEHENPGDLEGLKSIGVPVITCKPGGVPATLEALAQLETRSSRKPLLV